MQTRTTVTLNTEQQAALAEYCHQERTRRGVAVSYGQALRELALQRLTVLGHLPSKEVPRGS